MALNKIADNNVSYPLTLGTLAVDGTLTSSGTAFFGSGGLTTVNTIIRAGLNQTADVFQVQDSTAANYLTITSFGSMQSNITGYPARWSLGTGTATTTGFIIRGATSQTADLQQWQLTGGTTVTSISASGIFNTNSSQYGNTLLWSAPAATTYYLLATLPITSAGTYDHLQIEGIHGGWGSTDFAKSTFTFANRNAFSWKHYMAISGGTANFKLRAYSQVDGSVQIWASGAAAQFLKFAYNISSAQNISTVKEPLATTTAPSGTVVFDSSDTTTYPPVETRYGGFSVYGTATGTVPIIVRGASGQTNDMQQWLTWDGTTATSVASISSTGAGTFSSITTSGNLSLTGGNIGNGTTVNIVLSTGSNRSVTLASGTPSLGGGTNVVFIGNAGTAPTSNPTGGGILYVDTGALKYRGTSGAAATIVNADGTDPNAYALPTASTTVLGGVKVDGTTITINGSGVISGANTYSLPAASASVLGGIKVGSGLAIDGSDVLSVTYSYTSPLTLTPLTTGFSIAGGSTTSKTLQVNKTLTLDGTDSTTITFPSTSATIARTDAAQTFTGTQTIDVLEAASATGTTSSLFGNVTTGAASIAAGLTTGTLNLGTGSQAATGRTVNINTGATGTTTITTNIGSATQGAAINFYAGLPGYILNGSGKFTTPISTGTTTGISFTTGNSTSTGASGSITLDVGTFATGTAGSINIGTTNEASAITIGKAASTKTVTLNGILATTSPSITTSLTTPSTSFDLLNTTATTVNFAGAATTANFAASSAGIITSKTVTISGTVTTNTLASGVTSTVYVNNHYATSGTVVTNIGGGFSLAATGVSTLNLSAFNSAGAGAVSTINLGLGATSVTTTNIYGTTNHIGNVNLSGTTRELQLNGLAGNTGQILVSAGSGATPTWTDPGMVLISSIAFSGTQPSFSTIPQTYKKLVVQIVFTNIGGLAGTFSMSVNSRSPVPYTAYSTGSTTSTISTGSAAGVALTPSTIAPTTTNIYTIEMPNYTSPNPTMWVSGGVGAIAYSSRWALASTTSAITQVSFEATTNTWTGATGTAYVYGVN